jgi:hypothetical protein
MPAAVAIELERPLKHGPGQQLRLLRRCRVGLEGRELDVHVVPDGVALGAGVRDEVQHAGLGLHDHRGANLLVRSFAVDGQARVDHPARGDAALEALAELAGKPRKGAQVVERDRAELAAKRGLQ